MLATLEHEYSGDKRFAILRKHFEDMESAVNQTQGYALLNLVIPHLSAETIGELEKKDREELNEFFQLRDDGIGDADEISVENRFGSMSLDEITPLVMAAKNKSEPCPFASKDFEKEVVPFAKEVVEEEFLAEFEGVLRKRYRNFQSFVVALLAHGMVHHTLKACPMTKCERKAVEQMIDKVVTALEASDCQMHAFKDGNELADMAKECVKAEHTMKEKIYNVKTSLHHVWHDAETKIKVQEESPTRNLHRYQSEVYIELGLTKRQKVQK